METAYQDLLYFGYSWSDEAGNSLRLQSEFMSEIKIAFPGVVFQDAYDDIKGYRQEVYLPIGESDNYYSWALAHQWHNCSMTLQLMMMSADREPEQKEKFDRYFAMAKEQYPECFKPEALK